MNKYSVEGTQVIPTIDFDAESGDLNISGSSTPTNPDDFYLPLIAWVEKYAEKPAAHTRLNVKFDYYNSSTSKRMLDIFRILEGLYKRDLEVVINWHYDQDDYDILESGEDYASMVNVPFVFICE